MTEREFASCVALLCASIGKEMPREQSVAWYTMLGDLTVEQLKAGIIATIRSYTFAGFPPVGVIRENCGAKSGNIAAKDKPTLAWCDVRRAISRVGGYDSPNFEDPIINATIREMGGWVLLCDSTIEELVWREKDFLRMYASLSTCNLADERTERLAGITEKENGSALPAPVVDVGCLTTGGDGITRRIEVAAPKRIDGPCDVVSSLSKRLEFDDRETTEAVPVTVRSREEQIAALRAMSGWNA